MGLAAANIVLTGGNANFPQYKERFMQELRPLVPDIIPINVSYLRQTVPQKNLKNTDMLVHAYLLTPTIIYIILLIILSYLPSLMHPQYLTRYSCQHTRKIMRGTELQDLLGTRKGYSVMQACLDIWSVGVNTLRVGIIIAIKKWINLGNFKCISYTKNTIM